MTHRVTPSSFKRIFVGDDDDYATQVPGADLAHVAGRYGPILQVTSSPDEDSVTITGNLRHTGALYDDYTATPEWHGAIGDGLTHPAIVALGVGTLAALQAIYPHAESLSDEMDWLAIQAALNADGAPMIRGRAGATYYLTKGLHLRNGMVHTVDFRGSALDFSDMVATPPSGVSLVLNGGFSSGSNWTNTTLSPRTNWSFGGGAATFVDPAPGAGTSFGQFGQQITIPAGRWTVSAEITISEGASAGIAGRPYCGFAFAAGGIGLGYETSPVTSSVTKYTEGTEVIGFSFETTTPVTLWLTITGGNCDISVTDVVLTEYYINAAIWCDGANFGSQPYDSTTWRGGEIAGPGIDSSVRGFLHQTLESNDTRCHVIDANITQFQGGHVYADQAFLEVLRGGSTGYCNPCMQFLAGSQNAGENIRVSDHVFYNSGLCLDFSGGGEFFFWGCSFDYSDKIIEADRASLVRFHGCHFEGAPPSTTLAIGTITADFTAGAILTGGTSGALGVVIATPADGATSGTLTLSVTSGTFQSGEVVTDSDGGSATTTGTVSTGDVWFDLRGAATVSIVSGEIQMAGSSHNGAPYYIAVEDTLSTMELCDGLYNLQTASGRLASGAGVVRLAGRGHVWPGNALLGLMFSDNFQMDAFGGAGRITGTNTASDMSFDAPADGIGMMCALHTDGFATTRVTTVGEVVAEADATVGTDVNHGSVKFTIAAAYTGACQWRVFYPVEDGRITMDEFQWSKPDAVATIAHGPYAITNAVTTTNGSDVVTITDANCATLGTYGAQAGWTVAITGVTGNPGGIPNASINGTRTILERTGTNTYTVTAGAAATSNASAAGGAGIGTSYTQTNVLVFDRRFWVAVIGYDSVGRPIIGQESFQAESNFLVPCATTDWTAQNVVSYYAESQTPADPRDRVSRGRAPRWATHMMMVMDFDRMTDLAGNPPLYVTDYLANVV